MAKTKHPVAVTPGTTATLIVDANSARSSLFLQNFHATVRVYIGKDSSVTPATATGYLDPADTLEDDTTDDWWGITSSGTGDLRGHEVF